MHRYHCSASICRRQLDRRGQLCTIVLYRVAGLGAGVSEGGLGLRACGFLGGVWRGMVGARGWAVTLGPLHVFVHGVPRVRRRGREKGGTPLRGLAGARTNGFRLLGIGA